jgi:hypothetical protein
MRVAARMATDAAARALLADRSWRPPRGILARPRTEESAAARPHHACTCARPAHSLHRDFRRPWRQMLLPPHSLHSDFRRPWRQMLLPPHSLHRDF